MLSQDLHQRPSELVGLPGWIEREWGFEPTWYCLQFDRAVRTLGVFVTRKLDEEDDQGRRVYNNALDILGRMVHEEPAGPIDPREWTRSTRSIDGLFNEARMLKVTSG